MSYDFDVADVSDDVHMNSLKVPDFSLLSADKSQLSLGINRIAYPRGKSLPSEIIRMTRDIKLMEEHEGVCTKRLSFES